MPIRQVYILLPLLTYTNQNLQSQLSALLHLSPNEFDIHPISETKTAVQIHNLTLGYFQIVTILQQYEQQQKKIEIIEKNLRNYQFGCRQTSIQGVSIESLMKKANKYKQVKQENKNLKKLLQKQLENTEQVREQTQKTMKILREQFDTLVKTMQTYQKDKQKTSQNSKHTEKREKLGLNLAQRA